MFIPQTLVTVEEVIIIIYIAGYISNKITKIVCSKCAAGLVGLLNKANYSHAFIAAKQYQDLPTGGLVVHRFNGNVYIDRSRILYYIEKILHVSKVRSILVTLMLSKIQGKFECDSCILIFARFKRTVNF